MVDKLFIMGYFMGYLYKIIYIYISQMRKLTIQLLGYWLNPRFFIVQWLLIWIIYIYTWLYPLHYFHEIYPRPVPSPLRRNVSLGQRPSGPVGILVPKQPKDGMNGWGQKHIWLNPGRTYYELLWISVFDLLYIYIHITYFFHVPCASGRTDMLMAKDLFRFLWEDYWPSFLQLTSM